MSELINHENYETVMFNLLEKSYSRKEELQILEEIEADSFLQFEWNNWKQLQLQDPIDNYLLEHSDFLESLTKKEEKKLWVIHKNVKYAAAACVLFIAGAWILFVNNNSNKTETAINKPINKKVAGNNSETTIASTNIEKPVTKKVISGTNKNVIVEPKVVQSTEKNKLAQLPKPEKEITKPVVVQEITIPKEKVVIANNTNAQKKKVEKKYSVTVVSETLAVDENSENNKKVFSLAKLLINTKLKKKKGENDAPVFEITGEDNNSLTIALGN